MQVKLLNKEPIVVNAKQIIEPTLFESIKIEDGKICNIEYHQARVNRAYREFFKSESKLDLQKIVTNYPTKNLYRAKVVYNAAGLCTKDYYIYKPKKIETIMLVEMPNIDYKFKYLNRDFLTELNSYKADEFIITKNGYITDTTIANIVLLHKNSNSWHTPSTQLLHGTTLSRYLNSSDIVQTKIYYKDLVNYSKIALLNAMVDRVELDLV